MDIPVIATKTKVLSQYFDESAIYFLKGNQPEEFAEAVISLYKSRNLRKNLAANAKSYLQQYNWPNEEKKYLELISTISTH